jgi:hypothetical protein
LHWKPGWRQPSSKNGVVPARPWSLADNCPVAISPFVQTQGDTFLPATVPAASLTFLAAIFVFSSYFI